MQLRAIRIFLRVHKFATQLAVTGDTGWISSDIKCKISILRLWNKLVNLHEDRLPKKVLNYVIEVRQTKWIRKVEDICNELGVQFENNTLFDLACSTNKFLDEFKDSWKALLTNKPKLRTYVTFKCSYFTDNYVSLNLSRSQRSVLAQLRCGILPLAIETGRYSGVAEGNRVCKICNSDQVENEVHFLFDCNMYQQERAEFLDAIKGQYHNFINLQVSGKLHVLFTLEPRLFAKYVVKIFEKRQTYNCMEQCNKNIVVLSLVYYTVKLVSDCKQIFDILYIHFSLCISIICVYLYGNR